MTVVHICFHRENPKVTAFKEKHADAILTYADREVMNNQPLEFHIDVALQKKKRKYRKLQKRAQALLGVKHKLSDHIMWEVLAGTWPGLR